MTRSENAFIEMHSVIIPAGVMLVGDLRVPHARLKGII
jgi:hypothetical protein